MSETQAPPPKPTQLIARYIELRDHKKAAEAQYAAWRKTEYDDPMEEIEQQLLGMLNAQDVDSIKTKVGTAFRKVSTSVTTADGASFRRHVIGLEAWELVDWRPNKTAVNDLVKAGEPLPPGINRTTFNTVQIRRPGETA
jgi:hypothetical protein